MATVCSHDDEIYQPGRLEAFDLTGLKVDLAMTIVVHNRHFTLPRLAQLAVTRRV